MVNSMFYSHYSEIDLDVWPWKYFHPSELASNGDGSLLVNVDAIDRLEYMREIAGKPFYISSAYRDPIWNAKVGGAPMSSHKKGIAFDISLRNHDKNELYAAAKQAGFTGFGFYNTFLHVDTGRKRSWGKW